MKKTTLLIVATIGTLTLSGCESVSRLLLGHSNTTPRGWTNSPQKAPEVGMLSVRAVMGPIHGGPTIEGEENTAPYIGAMAIKFCPEVGGCVSEKRVTDSNGLISIPLSTPGTYTIQLVVDSLRKRDWARRQSQTVVVDNLTQSYEMNFYIDTGMR